MKKQGETRRRSHFEEPNLEGLKKRYPWWLLGHQEERLATSPEKANLNDTASQFEGRNTWV